MISASNNNKKHSCMLIHITYEYWLHCDIVVDTPFFIKARGDPNSSKRKAAHMTSKANAVADRHNYCQIVSYVSDTFTTNVNRCYANMNYNKCLRAEQNVHDYNSLIQKSK